MINLREHFKLSFIYTFFAAFPALLQLVVYPAIEGENRLGSVDFGYLAISEAIISVVFIICTFGMSSGLSRFYYDYIDKKNQYNRLVSTVLTSILARGAVLMGITLLFAPSIGALFSDPGLKNFGEYGPSLVIAGLNRSILTALLALYRNEKRVLLYITISFLAGIFRAGFQLAGVFFYDLSFIGYLHGTALGGSFIAGGAILYCYIKCGFHYRRDIIKSMLRFCRPLFFSDIILWGLLFADRFFLLTNPGELGIYDNTMKFAIGVQLIIQGLSNAIQPELFRYFRKGFKPNEKEIKTLSNLFIAESIGVIALAILPVMVFISLFYQTELKTSVDLVAIVFARFILVAQYKVFALPLVFAKKTKVFFFINSASLAINLALNWLLIPVAGYYGAIIAFFGAYSVQVILFSYMQNRYVPVRWNRTRILYFPWLITLTAILSEATKLVFNLEPFLPSVVFVMITLSSIYYLYNKELRLYLKKILT